MADISAYAVMDTNFIMIAALVYRLTDVLKIMVTVLTIVILYQKIPTGANVELDLFSPKMGAIVTSRILA